MKQLLKIIIMKNNIKKHGFLKILSAISLFIILSLLPLQIQAYFGFPYNMFGSPYYGFGIGIPYYGGIFGPPYVTAPPPDLSGWIWTDPSTAQYPYTLPGGVNVMAYVSPVAGYEGLSPYYQQNDDLGSSLGAPPSTYDQYGPMLMPGVGANYGGLYGGYGLAGYGLYGGLYGGYGLAGYGLYGGLYGGYGLAGYGLYGGVSSPISYDSFGGAWMS